MSLPRKTRLLVIRAPELLTRVLSLFLRATFNYQRRRARKDGIIKPMTGAVTLLQFWGSILQLTPHAHSWLPDGVFHTGEDGDLQFHRLPPPTDHDVEVLLQRIEARVIKACAEYDEDLPDDDELTMATSQYEASRPPLFTIPMTEEELKRPHCVDLLGHCHPNSGVHSTEAVPSHRITAGLCCK